jgi:endoglucanase
MQTKETLRLLCEATGVSGDEFPACQIAKNLLAEYIGAENITVSPFGNVAGYLHTADNLPTLLLDAHIDEIGFMVTYIEEDGFVRVGRTGGYDMRAVAAQTVTIWGKKPIKGIVSVLPPHVAKNDGKAMTETDMVIDTGYTKDELATLVALGDMITPDMPFAELPGGENRVTAKAIDDRGGVAALLHAAKLLTATDSEFANRKYNILFAFTSQEETRGAGAVTAAYSGSANYAIAVDASFARAPGTPEKSTRKMGSGVMIGISPALDRGMFERLKQLAQDNHIPYTIEVMPDTTGTNADHIVTVKGGIRCGLLSFPIRNMHMPVELTQISDIEAVGRLIAAYATQDGGDKQ